MSLATFFKNTWNGAKDAANYLSSGEKPYLISRTIYFNTSGFKALAYWSFYKQAFEKQRPTGLIKKVPVIVQDVGMSTGGQIKYLDFLYGGKKVVIIYDPSNMRVEEKRTAFEMNAQKEKAIAALAAAANSLTKSINTIGVKLALLNKKKASMTSAQQSRLNEYATRYLGMISKAKEIPELYITPDSAASGLQGLGEPVSGTVMLLVAVVIVGIVAYSINAIIEKTGELKEYSAQSDILNKALDAEQQALEDYKGGKITKEQYDTTVKNSQKIIENVQATQASIINSQDTGGFLGKIQNILMVGAGLFVLVKGAELLNSKKSRA